MTMDVVGLQWFLFSSVNIMAIIHTSGATSLKYNTSMLLKLWLFFLTFALVSLTYTINFTLGLQDISRWIQLIIGMNVFYVYLKKKWISFVYISNVIIGVLFVELLYLLLPLFLNLYSLGFETLTKGILTPGLFNGLTGNKNIAIASVMVKLPFVVYKIKSKKLVFSFITIILVVLSIISMLLISARASYISFILFTIFTSVFGIFYFKTSLRNKILLYFLPLIISYIIGFSLGNALVPSDSSTSLSNKISSISFTKSGSSGRTLLWSDALSFAKDHPLLGGGIGSWKIESAPYWNIHGDLYLMPYHAHNDFLEITAELGFLGGLLYFIIFSRLIFLFCKKIINNSTLDTAFFLSCFASLGIYLIDALFNFPMERYIMQITLCILFAVGMYLESKKLI